MRRAGGRIGLILGHALLIAACGSEAVGPEPGDTFTLEPGQEVTLIAASVRARFVEVSEDSRCPTGVQCVWEGDGAVVLEITPAAAAPSQAVLHTSVDPRAIEIGEFSLRLTESSPYPEEPSIIAPEDYRATLAFESAEP